MLTLKFRLLQMDTVTPVITANASRAYGCVSVVEGMSSPASCILLSYPCFQGHTPVMEGRGKCLCESILYETSPTQFCRFDRRFRIYQISDFGETIGTYKRTEHGEIVDKMVLVGKDAPPPLT